MVTMKPSTLLPETVYSPLSGSHAFPEDYPELDSEITVTGTFGTYMEDGFEYIRLADATLGGEGSV